MKKSAFAVLAILGLAATGCPDKNAPAAMEAKTEKRAEEIVSQGLANQPASAEPVSNSKSAEPVSAATATPVE